MKQIGLTAHNCYFNGAATYLGNKEYKHTWQASECVNGLPTSDSNCVSIFRGGDVSLSVFFCFLFFFCAISHFLIAYIQNITKPTKINKKKNKTKDCSSGSASNGVSDQSWETLGLGDVYGPGIRWTASDTTCNAQSVELAVDYLCFDSTNTYSSNHIYLFFFCLISLPLTHTKN